MTRGQRSRTTSAVERHCSAIDRNVPCAIGDSPSVAYVRRQSVMSEPLMRFKSHIDGKNAVVEIYPDRVEWNRGGISPTKITTGVMTAGVSFLATGLRRSKSGSEVIPMKAISSVTTKRDGLMYTKVQVICSGNTIDFRVPHGDAPGITQVLTDLLLNRHPRQVPTHVPNSSGHQAVSPGSGVADELTKLASLKASGILTDEEFQVQKRRLLGS